jgi:phage repressor protein C with HTH and peptisase S24 domain
MSEIIDKKLILNKIKDRYAFTSDTEFAKFLGVRPQTLSNWQTRNSFDIDILYTKCVNINPEFLLSGKGSVLKQEEKAKMFDMVEESLIKSYRQKTDRVEEKQRIPLYDVQASASIVSLFRDSAHEKPIDHISIPNLPKCDGAIYVSGDSMYPLLKSGDIIMYKKLEPHVNNMFWGEMYLVTLVNDEGDEFVLVKWLHKSDLGKDHVKLVSENRHHQPKDFHLSNIKGLALIKASVRINSMY